MAVFCRESQKWDIFHITQSVKCSPYSHPFWGPSARSTYLPSEWYLILWCESARRVTCNAINLCCKKPGKLHSAKLIFEKCCFFVLKPIINNVLITTTQYIQHCVWSCWCRGGHPVRHRYNPLFIVIMPPFMRGIIQNFNLRIYSSSLLHNVHTHTEIT